MNKNGINKSVVLITMLCLISLPLFGNMIRLKTYEFDPAKEIPVIPVELMTQEGANNYYSVQLAGPIEKQWKEELNASGAYILGYIPDYAYIVQMDKYQKELLILKSYVKWIVVATLK